MHSHRPEPPSHSPGVVLPPPPRRLRLKPGRRGASSLWTDLVLGTGVTLVCAALGAGWDTVRLDSSASGSSWLVGLLIGAFGTLLCVGSSAEPRRHKYLLKHGALVPGVVVTKSILHDLESPPSDTHIVWYRWDAPDCERTEQKTVAPHEYLSAEPGQPLTILFDPRNPGRNTPLEYADYFILARGVQSGRA